MDDTIICTFVDSSKEKAVDIEVPLYISCDEFVRSMSKAMQLNIAIPGSCAYFRAENPIALIQGEKTLADTGIRNGSLIVFERHEKP